MWWLLGGAWAWSATMGFVQGSSAVVRTQPEGDDVATLRINAEVEVTTQQGGWSHVRLVGRPEAHPVAGWVRTDLLRDDPVTLDEALRRSRWADSDEEATRWAERAFALAPHDADARQLRRGRAEVDGDDALAKRLADTSEEPVYVGLCEAGRARVLARVDGDRITPLSGRDAGSLRPLVDELGAWAWYEQGETTPLAGSPFPAPFLAPTDNEDGGDAYVAGVDALSGGEVSQFVVLGPCEGHGLLATHPLPLAEVGAAAAPRERIAEAWAASAFPVVRGRVHRPVRGVPVDEVRLTVWHEPVTCGGAVGYRVQSAAVAVVGAHEEVSSVRLADEVALGWVRLGDRTLGAYPSHDLAFDMVQLHLVGGDGPQSVGVHLAYRGC